jgi:hypothetical protein
VSDLKLNDLHDLDVTNQEISLVEDTPGNPAAITQEMRIALQFHRGEWNLNTLVGIPYISQVFIKNPSLAALTVLFTRAARSVPGIIEVNDMSLLFGNSERELSVDYRATAQDGGIIEDTLAVVL